MPRASVVGFDDRVEPRWWGGDGRSIVARRPKVFQRIEVDWTRMIRQSNAAATLGVACLALVVCASPLAFGAVLVRDRTLASLLICVAAYAALASGIFPRRLGEGRAALLPGLAVAAVGLFGLLQSLPLPRSVMTLLAPRLLPVWQRAGTLLDRPIDWLPLSLAPGVSRTAALGWLVLALALLSARTLGRALQARRTLGLSLLLVATFEVLYGGRRMNTDHSSIWGVDVPGDPSRLRGTYVNSDHLATLLLIALAVACGWLWWGLRRALGPRSLEQRVIAVLPPALTVVMLFAGLAFTGSRAGLLAALLSLLGMAAVLTLHYGRWQVGALGGAVALLATSGVALFGWRQGFARLLGTSAYEVTWNARLEVYRAALDLWTLSPWVGTGLGTFRQAFPLVQPTTVDGLWIHLHSDVLELAITTGVVGWPILAVALVVVGRRLWQVLHRGRAPEDRAAGLTGIGALIATGLHALVDFGLTMPANGMVLAIVVGAACAAPTTVDRPDPADTTARAQDEGQGIGSSRSSRAA